MTDDDYTPVPEADLEAAFTETLDLLRQNSATGAAAFAKLESLVREIKSRDETIKNVETLLYEVKIALENSKPKKQTKTEIMNDIASNFFIILICTAGIVLFLFLARKAGFISIYFE